ncbi:MAG: hypothetical protein O3B24_05655 [Verrucomicrobia bacterium]|nr:hypothetical protein [Verrucomicrobiota bacterium]
MKFTVAFLSLALCLSALGECLIQIGDSASTLQALQGNPTRVIETGDGTLAFYGQTLVFLTNGVVGFISMGTFASPSPAPTGVATHAAKPTPALSANAAPWEIINVAAPDAREQTQSRDQALASRARRCALTKSYAALGHDFRRALPLAFAHQPDCVSGMKDARGHALPTYGDTAWSPWYSAGVDLTSQVMAE